MAITAAKLRGVESPACCARRKSSASRRAPKACSSCRPMRRSVNRCASISQLDDAILELKVMPNRGDALSVLGIAREVAAFSGRALGGPPHRAGGADDRRHASRCARGARRRARSFASRVLRGIDNTRLPRPRGCSERLRRAGLRADQSRRRRHELRDARTRPADARLRPVAARGRDGGALCAAAASRSRCSMSAPSRSTPTCW